MNDERQIVARSTWSGPLPPPAEVERFQRILPNAAERLFAMAEEEQRIRSEIALIEANKSKAEAEAYHRRTSCGQFYGALVSLAFLMGAVTCAYLHQTAIGVALVGATIVGLVNAIVSPRKR